MLLGLFFVLTLYLGFPGFVPDKFYTLPARKNRRGSSESQDTNLLRRHSEELTQSPPRKPPRTFASTPKPNPVLNLFKREKDGKQVNLRRSRSDASNLRSTDGTILVRKRSGSESDELGHVKTKKTQLSPIIEVVQREDYFSRDADKENVEVTAPPRKKWVKPTKKLKVEKPEVVIIDVDKAQNISSKKKTNAIKNKLKSLSFKKDKIQTNDINETNVEPPPKSPRVQEAIKILEQSMLTKSVDMVHSSQQPPDKPPLTRGRKVDTMVKKLNTDKSFMPPKTNIMVTPTANIQHNNNQPFSYTQPRNVSPDRSFTRPKSPSSPVIYAQVVVQNGDPSNPGPNKQTIHTVYNGKKHLPHSDSDEGLGYEESGYRKYETEKSYTRFGDDKTDFYKDIDKFDEEFPITPKFKPLGSYTNGFGYIDSSARGRGDGMDSKRRESLTEIPVENGKNVSNLNGRSDLSYRRDLLESRINSRRIGEKIAVNRASPEYNPKIDTYVSEKTSYYRHGSSSPVGFTEKYSSETKFDRTGEKYVAEQRSRTQFGEKSPEYIRYDDPKSLDSPASDYRSSPENLNSRKYYGDNPNFRTVYTNRYKKSEKISKERDHYKSNPEINYKYDDRRFNSDAYHSSLRRQKHDFEEERKDKFGDSGIENDLRRDSGDRQRNDSEDEGFASSLLIASEKHIEDVRRPRREYDSDREQAEYRRTRHEYVHRERSIDDGSHFDPRIDKDVDGRNLRKVDKKPPKPVKKTSLEKVRKENVL